MKKSYLICILTLFAFVILPSCSEDDVTFESAPENSIFYDLRNTDWVISEFNGTMEIYISPTGTQVSERNTYRSTGSVYTRIAELYDINVNTASFAIRDNSNDVNDGLNDVVDLELINENQLKRFINDEEVIYTRIRKTLNFERGTVLTKDALGVQPNSKVLTMSPLWLMPEKGNFVASANGVAYLKIIESDGTTYAIKIIIGGKILDEKFDILPYELLLGSDINNVTQFLGSNYTSFQEGDYDGVEYLRQPSDKGVIQNVVYYKSRLIDADMLMLIIDDDAYDTVTEYLDTKYFINGKDENGFEVYFNTEDKKLASLQIRHGILNDRHMLSYELIVNNLFEDYSPYLGKSLLEVVDKFGDPISKGYAFGDDKIPYVYRYRDNSEYVDYINFFYNGDYSVYQVLLDLKKVEGVENYLNFIFPVFCGVNNVNGKPCYIWTDNALEEKANFVVSYFPKDQYLAFTSTKVEITEPIWLDLISFVEADYDVLKYYLGDPNSSNVSQSSVEYIYSDGLGKQTTVKITYSKILNRIKEIVIDTYNKDRIDRLTNLNGYHCYDGDQNIMSGDYSYFYDNKDFPQIDVRYTKTKTNNGDNHRLVISSLWDELGEINYNDALGFTKLFPIQFDNPYRVLEKNGNKEIYKIDKPFELDVDVIINATDPQFVSIDEQWTGYKIEGDYITVLSEDKYAEKYKGWPREKLKIEYPNLFGKLSEGKLTFEILLYHFKQEGKFVFYSVKDVTIDLSIVNRGSNGSKVNKKANRKMEASKEVKLKKGVSSEFSNNLLLLD